MPDDARTAAEWIAAFAARLGVEPPDARPGRHAARPGRGGGPRLRAHRRTHRLLARRAGRPVARRGRDRPWPREV